MLLRAEASKAIQAGNDADLAITTAASEIDQLSADLASLEAQVALPEGSGLHRQAHGLPLHSRGRDGCILPRAARSRLGDQGSDDDPPDGHQGHRCICAGLRSPMVPPAPLPAVGADAASSAAAPAHVAATAALQAQPADQ